MTKVYLVRESMLVSAFVFIGVGTGLMAWSLAFIGVGVALLASRRKSKRTLAVVPIDEPSQTPVTQLQPTTSRAA
jgi:hypothetical protein